MKANTINFAYTIGSNTGNLRTGGTGTGDPAAFASTWDNTSPLKYNGPDVVDRKNMLTFASITELKKGFVFSQITHWYSALPQNILIPSAYSGCQGGPEEIFGRSVKGGSGLNSVINKYNSADAGKPTPAGNLLVSQGLISAAQLQSLGG